MIVHFTVCESRSTPDPLRKKCPVKNITLAGHFFCGRVGKDGVYPGFVCVQPIPIDSRLDLS